MITILAGAISLRTGGNGGKPTRAASPQGGLACGRAMRWRKAWAQNWAEVRDCSNACRHHKTNSSQAP